jgi:hypothetical protein
MNSIDIEIDEKKEYYKPEITQISLSILTLGGGSDELDSETLAETKP